MKRLIALWLACILLAGNVAYAGFFGPGNYGVGLVGGGFNESTVSGLKLWLKADAGTTLDTTMGTTTVSTWSDQSGNGAHYTQSTKASQPTYVTGAINGRPVLRFNASHILTGNATALVLTKNLSGMTVFAVWKPATTGGDRHVLQFHTNTLGNTRFQLRKTTSDDEMTSARRLDADSTGTMRGNDTLAGAVSQTSFSISTVVLDYTNGDGWLYRNGTQVSSSTSLTTNGSISNTDSADACIGGFQTSAGGTLVGDIAEILIYNKVLTTSERTTVRTYLSQKYGITVSAKPEQYRYARAVPVESEPQQPAMAVLPFEQRRKAA